MSERLLTAFVFLKDLTETEAARAKTKIELYKNLIQIMFQDRNLVERRRLKFEHIRYA
jgi:hypothetical protein